MITVRSPFSRVTGVALIVVPLLALLLKCLSFGWMMLFLLFGPIFVLMLGYGLQIVIASQGFLSKRELFGAAMTRATTASWLSLLGVLVLGIFMPDGGDAAFGSTFQVWLGAYGPNGAEVNAATDGLTALIAGVAAIIWIAAYLWLVIEWIAALVRRKRGGV